MNEFNIENNIKVQGKIKLVTSMLISSGIEGAVDQLFIRDYKNNPIIPGSSIRGVLRNISQKLFENNKLKNKFNKFWGYVDFENNNESMISQIYIHDAIINENAKIEIRNNVSINRKNHVAEENHLFDYETLVPGTTFNFSMELRQIKYDEELVKIFYSLIKIMESGIISLGAKINNGLGKIKLIDTKIISYDFRNKSDIKNWFINKPNLITNYDIYDISILEKNDLIIEAEYNIISSLLIKSYVSNPNDVDNTNFNIEGKYYIPGSSIKGVIKSRMERIINTLNININLDHIFGYINSNESQAGLIIFNEIELKNIIEQKQTRIKIDKFTNSTIDGALFTSNVIWNIQNDKPNIKLKIVLKDYLNNKKYAAILLLALKDLWDGDLAIGSEQSIGRGRLIGKSITLKKGNKLVKYLDDKLEGDKSIIEELEESLKEVLN